MTQAEVIAFLRRTKDPVSPTRLGYAFTKSRHEARLMLVAMLEAGIVEKNAKGLYTLKTKNQEGK